MATSRLKLVSVLQTPAEAEVAHEDAEDEGAFVGWVRMDDANKCKGTKEEGKSGFVAGTIVKTTEATERLEKVGLEETEGGCVSGTEERAQEVIGLLRGVGERHTIVYNGDAYRIV